MKSHFLIAACLFYIFITKINVGVFVIPKLASPTLAVLF